MSTNNACTFSFCRAFPLLLGEIFVVLTSSKIHQKIRGKSDMLEAQTALEYWIS